MHIHRIWIVWSGLVSAPPSQAGVLVKRLNGSSGLLHRCYAWLILLCVVREFGASKNNGTCFSLEPCPHTVNLADSSTVFGTSTVASVVDLVRLSQVYRAPTFVCNMLASRASHGSSVAAETCLTRRVQYL